MSEFVSPTDLKTFLGVDDIDAARAQMFIEIVTDAIRGWCRQDVSPAVEDDVATLQGNGEEKLLLPQIPVTAVTSVEVDGTALSGTQFSWRASGVLRRLDATWGTESVPAVVEVTYDHGYDLAPPRVRGVCLAAAGRAYTLRDSPTAESLDGLSEAAGFSPEMVLTPAERRTLTRYRVIR